MNIPRKAISPSETERLFQNLIDAGELRFPKAKASPHNAEVLTERMMGAFKSGSRGRTLSAAELLLGEREKRQLTSERVAKTAGIALETYEALEAGKLSPRNVQPKAFARVLKALAIGIESYIEVHGRSVRPGSARNLTKKAALTSRPPSYKHHRVVSSASWLAKLSDAMQA